MLEWGMTSLIIAIGAAIVGFGGVEGTAVSVARTIFEIAIALFAVSALARMVKGNG